VVAAWGGEEKSGGDEVLEGDCGPARGEGGGGGELAERELGSGCGLGVVGEVEEDEEEFGSAGREGLEGIFEVRFGWRGVGSFMVLVHGSPLG